MGLVGFDALDGVLAELIMDFLSPSTVATSVMAASRLCFSASCCRAHAYFPKACQWRAGALGTLFEQDKKLIRAVSLVEVFADGREEDVHNEGAQPPDRLEQIVLRKQTVVALERAVNAAARHAEECLHVNAVLLKHASMLSHFFSWLKVQLMSTSCSASGAVLSDDELRRRHFVIKEAIEFHRRLLWLVQVAENFATLGGCGGALGRHQRLALVVHVARLTLPDGLGADVEERCEALNDRWRQATRKLDAIVYSLHVRDDAFVDMIRKQASQSLAALVSVVPASLSRRSSRPQESDGQSSIAKLSILTAIATSTIASMSGSSLVACPKGDLANTDIDTYSEIGLGLSS